MTFKVAETLLTLSRAAISSLVKRQPRTPFAASACFLFFTPAPRIVAFDEVPYALGQDKPAYLCQGVGTSMG
jgi:hypothetical protein